MRHKTCAKCGESKPSTDFATKHFCNACMEDITNRYLDRLGGE